MNWSGFHFRGTRKQKEIERHIKMDAKRGYVPEDERNFSPEAIGIMSTASRHIRYLLDEGYDLKQASTFVGNHFLLSERQRLAIVRSLTSGQQLSNRKEKQVSIDELAGREVWIDGFNIIITLEVLLSSSILFRCMDGTIRDLAALRGTYRLITETDDAVRIMLDVLNNAGAGKINILLDQPVSNSGRLKARIADIAEEAGCSNLDIQILRDVDRTLYEKELVITSDSVILDHCRSWVNLTEEVVKQMKCHVFQVW